MRLKENATVTLYVSAGKQMIPMPNLVSLSRRVAEETLRLKGFKEANITFEEREEEDIPPDQVIAQTPTADKQVVPEEEKVTVVISKEKEYVKMPDVRGLNIDQARVRLFNAGLAVAEDSITYQPTYTTEKSGIVISTIPWDPGMQVPAGTPIPLQVSNGKYPADAKMDTQYVYIDLPPGEPTRIRITVSDARGNDQTVVDEMISVSREYPVSLVLSPDKDGTINVYKNDEPHPYMNFTFRYDNLP
jgi:serine/threonine-protein kinase